jgi:hypothetical protein
MRTVCCVVGVACTCSRRLFAHNLFSFLSVYCVSCCHCAAMPPTDTASSKCCCNSLLARVGAPFFGRCCACHLGHPWIVAGAHAGASTAVCAWLTRLLLLQLGCRSIAAEAAVLCRSSAGGAMWGVRTRRPHARAVGCELARMCFLLGVCCSTHAVLALALRNFANAASLLADGDLAQVGRPWRICRHTRKACTCARWRVCARPAHVN